MSRPDRRIARTRKLLADALVSLVNDKPYDRITIRDLTERANIGYATFFRHFKSKDQLTSYVVLGFMEDAEKAVREESTPYGQALATYRSMQRHKDVLLLGISFPRDHAAVKSVWDKAREMVEACYVPRDESAIPFEVAVNHIITSVVELLRWWLDEGQAYSPEQMATMQSELVFKLTEQVALEPRGERQPELDTARE